MVWALAAPFRERGAFSWVISVPGWACLASHYEVLWSYSQVDSQVLDSSPGQDPQTLRPSALAQRRRSDQTWDRHTDWGFRSSQEVEVKGRCCCPARRTCFSPAYLPLERPGQGLLHFACHNPRRVCSLPHHSCLPCLWFLPHSLTTSPPAPYLSRHTAPNRNRTTGREARTQR